MSEKNEEKHQVVDGKEVHPVRRAPRELGVVTLEALLGGIPHFTNKVIPPPECRGNQPLSEEDARIAENEAQELIAQRAAAIRESQAGTLFVRTGSRKRGC